MAAVSLQHSLAATCTRIVDYQTNRWRLQGALNRQRGSKLRVRCGLAEEKKVEILPPTEPEVLKLKKESDVRPPPPPKSPYRASPRYKRKPPPFSPSTASAEAAGEPSPSLGTLGDVVQKAARAVEETPVESAASVALYAGAASLSVLFSSTLLGAIDSLPLLPHLLQMVGFVYCGLVVSEFLMMGRFTPLPSPFNTLSFLIDGAIPKTANSSGDSEELKKQIQAIDEKAKQKIRELKQQRDAAIAQADELRKTGQEMGRVVAEKEALEAVAMQLAEERDGAVSEVTALKTAVNAMTERMKSIESMLAREVERLQEQNVALETVALQLADERDSAIKQVEELKNAFEAQREEDKRVLEMLAAQLIEERNVAMKEVEELKQVVNNLSHASGLASGLTPEMETFIKSRARDVRSQFVDITKSYEEQKEAVDTFVMHLVDEYGAPRKWTSNYIRQFLNSSSESSNAGLSSSPQALEEPSKQS